MKRVSVCSCISVVIAVVVLVFSVSAGNTAENNYELYIARGMEELSDGRHAEALGLFQKALEMAPNDTEAVYYTAIAHTRLGELAEAEELFLKIKESDSVPAVNFELGRIYYVKGECDRASAYLSKYVSISDDESLKDYAETLIGNCGGADQAADEEEPYRLSITAGIQYDDNVIVEPENPIVIEDKKQSDSMAMAYLAAGADLLNKGAVKLKADYAFYQNLHFDLNDYDVQSHKISPFLEIDLTEIIKPTIGYSYEHTFFGDDVYSKVNTLFITINVKQSKDYSTDLTYKYRDLSYDDSEMFLTNSIRSGHQNIFGLMQNFAADKLNGDVYYYYSDRGADEGYWAYKGNRLGADVTYRLMTPLYVMVSGQYTEERYRDDFPGFSEQRSDKTRQYSLVFTYKPTDRFIIYLTDDYTNNDSNLDTFQYERNVIGLLLTYTLL